MRPNGVVVQEPSIRKLPNMKMSHRRLADYVKKLHQKACRTCSTIIFPHSTNQTIDLCCCCCPCHFLIYLFLRWQFDPCQLVQYQILLFHFPTDMAPTILYKLNLSFLRKIKYAEAHQRLNETQHVNML